MTIFFAYKVEQSYDRSEDSVLAPVNLYTTKEKAMAAAQEEWVEVYNQDEEEVAGELVWGATADGVIGRPAADTSISFIVYPLTVKG